MITGREPNIARLIEGCQSAAPAAGGLDSSKEKVQQKLFGDWLKIQRERGRLWFINPFGHKASTIATGHPDYTIFLPGGRLLLIEMKVAGGDLSPAQRRAHLALGDLGHAVAIEWDHRDAIELVEFYLKAKPHTKT